MASWSGLKTGGTHTFVVAKIGDVEFTLKDEGGAPLKNWNYRLTAPDGKTYEGKLDANGHAKVEKVLDGDCQLILTEDKLPPAPDKPPPPPPPPPPTPPPPPSVIPSKAGDSDASDLRRKELSDVLGSMA
jgi:hypothetical protein